MNRNAPQQSQSNEIKVDIQSSQLDLDRKTVENDQLSLEQTPLIRSCNEELSHRFWLLSFKNKALEHGYIHQTNRFPKSFLWLYLLLSYLLFLSVIGVFLYFWPNPIMGTSIN